MSWQVETLSDAFMRRVRDEGVDDQRQPLARLTARGGEPCRDALRRALPGEPLILASYCPFRQAGPYREYGPVFLLAVDEAPPSRPDILQYCRDNGYLGERFALRAYDSRAALVEAEQLRRWTGQPQIASVQLRFAAHGCYPLRLIRKR